MEFNTCCSYFVSYHDEANNYRAYQPVLIDFSLTVKAVTSGRGSAISSAEQVKSGSIYNLVKTK